jgi:transposase
MPTEKYKVELTEDELKILNEITHKGKESSAKTIMHANVLLQTNDSSPAKKTDREIAEMFSLSKTTVNQIRKTYATEGLKNALYRKTRLTAPILSKITGDFEARVIATALGPAPQERAKWTLRLLAEHCMEKQYIVSVSYVTIGEMLNTNQVKPHISEYWCIPKENDASFVANMEDVLNIYQQPYNPRVPVICMDEKPIQFLSEVRQRIQAKPLRLNPDTGVKKGGNSEKIDSEYVRCGHGSIFIVTEPLAGWRHVEARNTRKKEDFALIMRKVMEQRLLHAEKVILIADNLNTHNKASFYEAFEPQIAFHMAQKFEFHYTPAHGSWLNIAECELSSLAKECLGKRRIDNIDLLNEILSSWECDRNKRQKGVNWQFTTADARVKLKRLYPTPMFSEEQYIQL